jgi:hypothetical protein
MASARAESLLALLLLHQEAAQAPSAWRSCVGDREVGFDLSFAAAWLPTDQPGRR